MNTHPIQIIDMTGSLTTPHGAATNEERQALGPISWATPVVFNVQDPSALPNRPVISATTGPVNKGGKPRTRKATDKNAPLRVRAILPASSAPSNAPSNTPVKTAPSLVASGNQKCLKPVTQLPQARSPHLLVIALSQVDQNQADEELNRKAWTGQLDGYPPYASSMLDGGHLSLEETLLEIQDSQDRMLALAKGILGEPPALGDLEGTFDMVKPVGLPIECGVSGPSGCTSLELDFMSKYFDFEGYGHNLAA